MKRATIISLTALVGSIATVLTNTFDNTMFIGILIMYCTSFIVRELEEIKEKL